MSGQKNVQTKKKIVLIIVLSLFCFTCIIFLTVWGIILIQHSCHDEQLVEEIMDENQLYESGQSVAIQDEDYIAGVKCANEYNFEEAESLLIRAYDRIADKNSIESAKISQSIGVLYLLTYRYKNASEYLLNSYIAFRDTVGEEEDNTTFTRCLLAYCDCLNGDSERAFADLDDIFWSSHHPEIRFLNYMLTLKAYNEMGQYKKAYDYLVLTEEYLISDRSNFVPDEFKSPIIPDITIVNYHEILGDIYSGLECYTDARSHYLISAELLIDDGKNFNSFEAFRLITKVAQSHILAGYSLEDTCYLVNSDYTFEEYLTLLLDVAKENNDSALYYSSFELAINLAKAFRLSDSNDLYHEAMNLVLDNYKKITDKQNGQFYIIEAKALTEYGLYYWEKTKSGESDLLSKAEECFLSAVQDMKQLLLDEHADVAKLYHLVAVCCLSKKDYETAYSSEQHSIQIYEKAVGRNTPQAYQIFVTLGTVEGYFEKYEDAFDHLDYALDLADRYYGVDSDEYETASRICDDVVAKYTSGTTGGNP